MASSNRPNPYVWQRHSFAGKRWPRSRTARSFLMLAPWIDLMVCAVLVFILTRQTIVQPGRVVELPQAEAEEGLLARYPTAVVRRLKSPDRPNVTVLLLDEGRYSSDKPAELQALAQVPLYEALNLVVDQSVSYGETVAWMERLRACGARCINLVATPPTPPAAPTPKEN